MVDWTATLEGEFIVEQLPEGRRELRCIVCPGGPTVQYTERDADQHRATESHERPMHRIPQMATRVEDGIRAATRAREPRDAHSIRPNGSDLEETATPASRQPTLQEPSEREAATVLPHPFNHGSSLAAPSTGKSHSIGDVNGGCFIQHADVINITQQITHQQEATSPAQQSRILPAIQQLESNLLIHKRKLDVLAEELQSFKRQRQTPIFDVRADRLEAFEAEVRAQFWRTKLTSRSPSSQTTLRMLLLVIPSIDEYEKRAQTIEGFEVGIRNAIVQLMYKFRAELKSGIVKHMNNGHLNLGALYNALERDASTRPYLNFNMQRALLLALFRKALTYDERSRSYSAPDSFWSDIDSMIEKHNTSENARDRFLTITYHADLEKFGALAVPL